jgi:hypothetical protein
MFRKTRQICVKCDDFGNRTYTDKTHTQQQPGALTPTLLRMRRNRMVFKRLHTSSLPPSLPPSSRDRVFITPPTTGYALSEGPFKWITHDKMTSG